MVLLMNTTKDAAIIWPWKGERCHSYVESLQPSIGGEAERTISINRICLITARETRQRPKAKAFELSSSQRLLGPSEHESILAGSIWHKIRPMAFALICLPNFDKSVTYVRDNYLGSLPLSGCTASPLTGFLLCKTCGRVTKRHIDNNIGWH